MQTPSVCISHATIIDLAECTIVKFTGKQTNLKCDFKIPKPGSNEISATEPCSAEVSCRYAMQEHLLEHSKKMVTHCQSQKTTRYRCSLPRCKVTAFFFLSELREHVSDSHMSAFPWPCPFKGCTTVPKLFFQQERLVAHVEEVHGDRMNQSYDLDSLSEILLPRWSVFRPRTQPAPPPLPHSVLPAYTILANVRIPPIKHLMRTPSPPPPSQLSTWSTPSQTPSARRRRMRPSSSQMDVDDQGLSYRFADLRPFQFTNDEPGHELMHMMVWPRHPKFDWNLSRPAPMLGLSELNVVEKQSILHSVFWEQHPLPPDEPAYPSL